MNLKAQEHAIELGAEIVELAKAKKLTGGQRLRRSEIIRDMKEGGWTLGEISQVFGMRVSEVINV